MSKQDLDLETIKEYWNNLKGTRLYWRTNKSIVYTGILCGVRGKMDTLTIVVNGVQKITEMGPVVQDRPEKLKYVGVKTLSVVVPSNEDYRFQPEVLLNYLTRVEAMSRLLG